MWFLSRLVLLQLARHCLRRHFDLVVLWWALTTTIAQFLKISTRGDGRIIDLRIHSQWTTWRRDTDPTKTLQEEEGWQRLRQWQQAQLVLRRMNSKRNSKKVNLPRREASSGEMYWITWRWDRKILTLTIALFIINGNGGIVVLIESWIATLDELVIRVLRILERVKAES